MRDDDLPNKQNARLDLDYYLNRHIPWAIKLNNDRGTEIRKGMSTPGGERVPYVCLCRFWISSEEEYRAMMEKHGKELMADLANFTNIEPVVADPATLNEIFQKHGLELLGPPMGKRKAA